MPGVDAGKTEVRQKLSNGVCLGGRGPLLAREGVLEEAGDRAFFFMMVRRVCDCFLVGNGLVGK